jgi:hypothetical protein
VRKSLEKKKSKCWREVLAHFVKRNSFGLLRTIIHVLATKVVAPLAGIVSLVCTRFRGGKIMANSNGFVYPLQYTCGG